MKQKRKDRLFYPFAILIQVILNYFTNTFLVITIPPSETIITNAVAATGISEVSALSGCGETT